MAQSHNVGWIDKGAYYLHDSKQGSKGWFTARDELILTASRFEQAANGTTYGGTSEELATELASISKPLTADAKINIDRGVRNEPYVRKWFSTIIKREITEIGVARPKFNLKIGGSPDGVIYHLAKEEEIEAIIEIKCCTNMYKPLITHRNRIEGGWTPPPFYHDHIWSSHYAQMQGCMAILQAQYCMYIVYCQDTKQVYVEKVMRNVEYWDKELYPKLVDFITKYEEKIVDGRRKKS